jgi:hypothetical protein
MEFTAEKKQTSTDNNTVVSLEDIISHYRIVSFTLTTSAGELRYITCMVCWNLDTTRKDKYVLEPVIFCLLTFSAIFRFTTGILKQLFSLTVYPSLTNLIAGSLEDQVLPLEFYIWLLFNHFDVSTSLV